MVNLLGSIKLKEDSSINYLSKQLKLPYTSVYRQIKSLYSLGVVKFNLKGGVKFTSLNFNNELTRNLLSVTNYFKRKELFKREIITSLISKEFKYNVPLLIFGSRIKGKVRDNSDFDLCAIGLSKKEEDTFKKSIKNIELIHKVEINCLFFKKNEIVAMLTTDKHNVGKEILVNHMVLNNVDLWYNLIAEVYDEIRL